MSPTSFAMSNNFSKCLSPHGCTLLITEVAIYFILGSLCYFFHTNSFSLRVLFLSRVREIKNKPNLKGTDAHAVHKFKNPICKVISVSVT